MGIAAFVLSTLRRCTLLVCWTATSLWVLLGLAQAKDLETLSRILIPAYMAQQFAAVCVVNNPSFLEETAGPQGHVHVYAKHVTEEVISELERAAVEVVLRMAADTARSVVRAELAQLPAGTLVEDSAHLADLVRAIGQALRAGGDGRPRREALTHGSDARRG